jgi:hypothetical protein
MDVMSKSVGTAPERAGGAMAVFFSKIDRNKFCIMGRWHSHAVIRYLHGQVQSIIEDFATRMYNDGTYNFQSDENVPIIDSYDD